MRIAVIGASGIIGRYLIPRLSANKHIVHAVAQNLTKLNYFAYDDNVNIISANILQRDTLIPAVKGCEAVVNIATALSKPGFQTDYKLNDRIRREGTENLISVCQQEGVKFYLQQSIAFLTNSSDKKWLNEDSPISTTKVTQSAAEMEELVKDSKLNWNIVRGGALYGPGTGREKNWIELAKKNELTLCKEENYISLIHVSDFATAMLAAIESQLHFKILNIVDDEPVTYKELFNYIATILGKSCIQSEKNLILPSFRVSNTLAKSLIKWRPYYSNYKLGMITAFV